MRNTYALLGKIHVGENYPVRIMGIINVSPESFYKKSVKISKEEVISTVEIMVNSGADIIDIGARSSAPYINTYIPLDEEMNRAIRAIKIIKDSFDVPISIDTTSSKVAEAALKNDVEIVNDVSGLKADLEMAKVIADYNASLVIVARMNNINPLKSNIINCTVQILRESLNIAYDAGIQPKKIVIDPGIGFPSSLQVFTERKIKEADINEINRYIRCSNPPWYIRDIALISGLYRLKTLNHPILISVSRKSFLWPITGREMVEDRLYGSIAATAIAIINGANVIRTHDVSETRDAVKVAEWVRAAARKLKLVKYSSY
ncbi:MAG: dihydropteroate synthase [Candidatus Methanomethylicia archaeon]